MKINNRNRKINYRFLNSSLLIVFLYINIFLCASLFSQTDSLSCYLVLAARNNPAVQQKFYEYKAALEKTPQAGSLSDPELNLGVFIQPMELVNGNQIADIKLMQMFPWFGTLKAAKDEMSLMAKAKFELFRDAQFQVFYDVEKTWYELQKVKSDIQTSGKNLDILHAIERLSIIRYKTTSTGTGETGSVNPEGSMPGNSMGSSRSGSGLADLYRIQMEINELENYIELMKIEQKTIAARFNYYLNRPSESTVYLPEELLPDSLTVSLPAITDSIQANNPMLSMLDYEQRSVEAKKKMVTQMGYPMLGLGLNYSIISKNPMSTSSMNGQDMIMPMATVTLPVYRGKYKAMRNEADFLNSAVKQNYISTSHSLKTEYYEAVQLLKDGQRRMILYDKQCRLAEKTLEIMLTGFSTSSVTLTDILRVRQQTIDYEFKKIEAVSDYNTAIAWLKRLMAKSDIQEN